MFDSILSYNTTLHAGRIKNALLLAQTREGAKVTLRRLRALFDETYPLGRQRASSSLRDKPKLFDCRKKDRDRPPSAEVWLPMVPDFSLCSVWALQSLLLDEAEEVQTRR